MQVGMAKACAQAGQAGRYQVKKTRKKQGKKTKTNANTGRPGWQVPSEKKTRKNKEKRQRPMQIQAGQAGRYPMKKQ